MRSIGPLRRAAGCSRGVKAYEGDQRPRRSSFSILTLALTSVAGPALAQATAPAPVQGAAGPSVAAPTSGAAAVPAPSGAAIPEVIVTAEKRSTNLQRTPIAVTALNSATLNENQVRNLEDIQNIVPNFKMGDSQGVAQITIRGVGSSTFIPGSEGAVAVNLDEVYVSRNVAQLAGLFDVSDIEVLRGPQGTLYGRNATAGSVNITTGQPTASPSGYGRISFGNYGEVRLETAISGPVIDNRLTVRLAAFRETHDGYGRNTVTGTSVDDKDDYGLRGTIVAKPVEHVKATLIAEYTKEDDHSGAFHYLGSVGETGLAGSVGTPPLFQTLGGYAPSNVRDVANGLDTQFHLRTAAVTGILEYDRGPFSVKSITGYRDQKVFSAFDIDGGSTPNYLVFQGEPANQFSEELQGHYDTARVHVTAGAYYFHEKDDAFPLEAIVSTTILHGVTGINYPSSYFVDFGTFDANLITNAGAGFLQGTYQVTDELSLTAGVRYSAETKHEIQEDRIDPITPFTGSNTVPQGVDVPSKTFYSTTPKFGIQYQFTPKTLLYASYSKGFKSGGFDVTVTNPQPYRPEKLTDYEVGLKTTALDNRFRANISGFYYDYTDLQVLQLNGFTAQTENAATAHDYGMEGDFTFRVTPPLQLDATVALTHARYDSYVGPDPARPLLATVDVSGHALDNAPDYQATVGGQYTFELPRGRLTVRGQAEYSSRYYFSPANLNIISQSAYVKGDLFATYRPDANWEFTAYLKNVSDKTTRTSALAGTALVGSPVLGSLAPPRLVGGELQYKF